MASLRDLGLSEYEARAYRALLNAGPTTAKELSRASDVPMGRIYDVLNSIETYNLARSQTASRPKKYVAVEPQSALDRLLENKRRELEEKVGQYETIVDELMDELDAVEPVKDKFWTAAVGPDDTVDLLLERLDAAEERIAMMAADSSPQFDLEDVGDLVVEHLIRALDRGVDISLLMTPDVVASLPRSVGERYTTELSDHDRFEVRTNERLDSTFNLIDETEVCIEVTNPLDSELAFAMIDLKDPGFATEVHDEFVTEWQRAESFDL